MNMNYQYRKVVFEKTRKILFLRRECEITGENLGENPFW